MSPAIFNDDEPLPPPSGLQAPEELVTIETIPESDAIAASTTFPDFQVVVKLVAPKAKGPRAPIDLVTVLDVSGSMYGKSLALVKRALGFIIDNLGPSDRLSIVSFSDNANRVLKLSCMTTEGRRLAINAVDSLEAYGWTNIKDGLETAVQVLKQRRYKNPAERIVLLSDGEDNRSAHGLNEDKDHPYAYLLPSEKVKTHTLGYGSSHEARALVEIATATGGMYSYIEVEEDVQEVCAMLMGRLLSIVAQKIKLMIHVASAGVRILSLDAGSYKSEVMDRGKLARVKLRDMVADEERKFIVHLSLPMAKPDHQLDTKKSFALIRVGGSYTFPMTQEEIDLVDETSVVQRPDQLSPSDRSVTVSLAVDRQRNRLLVGKSMQKAYDKAENKDLEGAKAVLNAGMSELMATPSARAKDVYTHWLRDELGEVHNRMASMDVYQKSGRAFVLSGICSHMSQRPAAGAIAARARNFKMTAVSNHRTRTIGTGGNNISSNNSWYQTPAMQEMVQKSRIYCMNNPLPN